jgi:hypothetical protein
MNSGDAAKGILIKLIVRRLKAFVTLKNEIMTRIKMVVKDTMKEC